MPFEQTVDHDDVDAEYSDAGEGGAAQEGEVEAAAEADQTGEPASEQPYSMDQDTDVTPKDAASSKLIQPSEEQTDFWAQGSFWRRNLVPYLNL